MKLCVIDVLGSKYSIYAMDKDDEATIDAWGENHAGYCDPSVKEIVLRGSLLEPEPGSLADLEHSWKAIMRHEIIHAFLYEGGLTGEVQHREAYYGDELLIDWLAIQTPKIFKAFQTAGCL